MTPEDSAKFYAKPLVERLADLEHQQWMQWARTLMEKEPGLSPERRARWQTLMVPFDELPEEWKEYDREWARKVTCAILGTTTFQGTQEK